MSSIVYPLAKEPTWLPYTIWLTPWKKQDEINVAMEFVWVRKDTADRRKTIEGKTERN